jgi:hypothetical protein
MPSGAAFRARNKCPFPDVMKVVKTSGLPCRATPDCEEVFTLSRQDSMEALREAADRRNAHEVSAHGYHHVVRELPGATPFAQGPAVRKRARRKAEELSVV